MSIKLNIVPHLTFSFFTENCSYHSLVSFTKQTCLLLPKLHLEQYSLKNLTVTEINVILISVKKITRLNKVYRQKENSTDVLSFPYNQEILGEIYLCPTEVIANAKHFNNTLINELTEVLCHSVLHLLDYKHGEKMFTLQKKLASSLQRRFSKLC